MKSFEKNKTNKVYCYVGEEDLSDKTFFSLGVSVNSTEDIENWIAKTKQKLDLEKQLTVTFIVDLDKTLWIADRHSEHYVCAKGNDVFAAGEITFQFANDVEIIEITNQSTGYCPQSSNWQIVAEVIDEIGLPRPDSYTTAFVFRFCTNCESINIIKDDWFYCDVCNRSLDKIWNFHSNFTRR